MKILIVGATGNSGQRLAKAALERNHEVTVFVRNLQKLEMMRSSWTHSENLKIVTGTAEEKEKLENAMVGKDAVINAAGTAGDSNFSDLVKSITDSTHKVLGDGARFWFFGGAAALDVPGTDIRAAELPIIRSKFKCHLDNFSYVSKTKLDWSMLCPGPMNPAKNGVARAEGLRITSEIWPVEPPKKTMLPQTLRIFSTLKKRMPEMIISYEDAAKVILDNLDRDGPFCCKRVGVALPPGETDTKKY